MSLFYKTNNKESTLKLFNKGVVYRDTILNPSDNNIVNFNWGEKFLYGRVRRDSTPIILSSQDMLKNISSGLPEEPVEAVGFVTDVFEAMVLQFQKCVILNKISADDPYLSNLVAYRAYMSPVALYEDYKQLLFNEIGLYFGSNNIRVKDFEEFIQILRSVAYHLVKTVRFTFPGFVKSKDCPILCSGLAIEIAPNQDAANDDAKIENFIGSKNWDFFVNTCDTYGFMIDYNVPWRIVADIDSEIMRNTAANYGYVNVSDLLGRGYHSPASSYVVNSLGADMYELYNMIRSDYWTDSQACGEFYRRTTTYASKTYSPEEFEYKFSYYYFLELYLFLRLCEERPNLCLEKKNRLVNEVLKVVKSANPTTSPLAVFERIINKEFDKIGSYSYIKEAIKIKKEISFEKGERDAIRMNNENDISSY